MVNMPNTFGNFFMKAIITSPFHALLGPNLALITVTGRKTGKAISTPINVVRDGDAYIVISMRNRTWWRNLRGAAMAQLRAGGKTYAVRGEIAEDVEEVSAGLRRYFQQNPQYARYFDVRVASDGQADQADLQRAATERIIIRLLPVT
jgi:deazaflavin-dependent oxidoreductase (nitroreductase family)